MTTETIRPTIPAERYAERLRRAAEATAEHGFDAMLVAVGSDLRYLTAYAAMPRERLTMLVVIPGHAPTIVVPRLERGAVEASLRADVTIMTWNELRDPYDVVTGLLLGPTGHAGPRIAVSDTLWASHLLRLQAALRTARFEPASPVLADLRVSHRRVRHQTAV